ncbi:MAG: helix-turn-helix transcriptional regulator [Pseudonocardiaceae bacterium]
MGAEILLVQARRAARMSQDELARRARTSRPTLSAYEHGRKSPTLETAARLLAAAGFEFTIQSWVQFVEQTTPRGRAVSVPTSLPRLPIEQALATVALPLHLNWSAPGRQFPMRDRSQRARVYEIVLREGGPEDVLTYIDGVLLIDLWDELVLPRDIRAAWAAVVGSAVQVAA